jgi:predicted DNA-binding transcriptional regulator YafY
LTMAQLAARFNCSRVTVERKLAELRNHACKNNFETTATSMAIAKLTTHVKS